MKPLVSVLIPVYNTEKYLPACLESIVNQTYPNLQVVVVDDGSKDASLSIAQEYASKYSFMEVYHQDNAGVAAARNHLLSHVKGEYVLFVDSDDWIEPDMIDFLVSKAEEVRTGIVICGMVVNNTAVSKEYKQEIWEREEVIRKFLFHNELSGSLCNKLIKMSLLHNLKFELDTSYGEDALFCWKFLQKVKHLLYTDRQLYHYRTNEVSISHQKWTPQGKGSGHKVWTAIVSDTKKWWPQYVSIAKARYATEDMWALYFAALSGYKYDEHIQIRQRNVRKNLRYIKSYRLLGLGKYLFAWGICRWYSLGKLIKMLQ